MTVAWITAVMAVILVGTAIYSICQQERLARELTADLREVLDEAVLVKQDLQAAMDNALLISEKIVNDLEEKLALVEEAGEQLVSAASRGPGQARLRSALPFELEDLRKAHPYLVVPRLYQQGFTVPEIAELLNRGKGEIKLILNLYQKKEACS
ncbi:MAG: hypothetical protein GXX09_05085 [Syntrophomonadaceae bacterium]|nr:hypothetical protein [Syntrophomonadaceae bacterium]